MERYEFSRRVIKEKRKRDRDSSREAARERERERERERDDIDKKWEGEKGREEERLLNKKKIDNWK